MQKVYKNQLRLVRLTNGTIGKVLIGTYGKTKGIELFYPLNYGSYCEEDLPLLDASPYTESILQDYINYIIKSFPTGSVIKVHIIGEYQIVEFKRDEEIRFHAYINYHDTSVCYETLDNALTGVICEKFEGGNGRANMYLWMILNNYKD